MKTATVSLSHQQLSTILAALLFWNSDGKEAKAGSADDARLIAADGIFSPMSDDEAKVLESLIEAALDEAAESPDEAATAGMEAACRAAGWDHGGDAGGFIFHVPTWGHWKAAASLAGTHNEPEGENDKPTIYDNWRECFEGEDLNHRP